MAPTRGLLGEQEAPDGPGYWGQTAMNLYPSAKGLLGDLRQMVLHPIQTIGGVLSLGHSLINLAVPEEQGNEELAKAVGEYFADRYGGADALKDTLRDDPVGIAADVAMLISGGAGAAAKAGGKAGQLASAVQKAARFVDPAELAVRGATAGTRATRRAAAKVGGSLAEVAGVPSGVGRLPLEAAYAAGREGGKSLENLLDAMRTRRPQADIDMDIIARANTALAQLGEARRAAYRTGMESVAGKAGPLFAVDLSPLKLRIGAQYDQFRIGPNKTLREGEPGVQRLREIERKIAEFEAEGATSVPDLDILKREIDALMGEASTGAGRSANAITSTVRNDLRAEIIKVDPEYKSIMEGYEAATKLERELMKDLSLSKTATDQAALRKLIQSLRDGVNTNMGGRAGQVNRLDPQLTDMIAGRTLSPKVPAGMARYMTPVAGIGAFSGGASAPQALAAMLSGSPRVMGEAAVLAGTAARKTPAIVGQVARQVGPLASGYVNAAGNAARVALPVQRGIDEASQRLSGQTSFPVATPGASATRPSMGLTKEELEERFRQLTSGRR